MKTLKKTGFTLLELLVVVAVIGVFAAIIIAALSTARNRSSDTTAKATMGNLRTQADIYASDNGGGYAIAGTAVTHATNCTAGTGVFADSKVSGLVKSIMKNTVSVDCYYSQTTYAMRSNLKGGGMWCVDSVNQSISGTINTTTGLCQ